MSDVWPQLGLSLEFALSATLIAGAIGIPLAAVLARRRFLGKSVLEAALFIPLVLPPTVIGFMLLRLFGNNGPIGGWLLRQFDYTMVFSHPLAIIANAVVAFPLTYLPAKAGFAGIAREYLDVAKLLGIPRWTLFWKVLIPLASRPVVSGVLLAFARALGEFGATNMVFGWRVGNTTLPIAVYADYEQGDLAHAMPAVLTLIVMSVAIALVFNLTSLGQADSQP